ncbi:MAG TPA: serine/threonine-protein kinase [Polyangiaceae bacterium]|nr:serine/threonine-protein kinase [Polyangiaceae bacterium]
MGATETTHKLDASASAPELSSTECLSDEDVLAFANGTLDSSRKLAAHLHFDQCEICQRLLSEAAHALATAVTAPLSELQELSWHTTFQPGTLVGNRYLIRHFIARGGMGEVYQAFDRELQERVALKTVTSTACDNAGAVRRLKAEVQLARRVSHANVCRIYDFGTHVMPDTGGQVSFLTMEFVEGETLGQRIRLKGALPVDEARRLGRELLRGLCAAHEAGILHRDFKSDNVMLRDEANGACSPLILDFGLARALDEGSRHSSRSHPNLLGTFGYIAPEQLQGRPHTTASDVYSFGLVWFEMLTGELPFESPSSPVGTALARLQVAAPAPSSKNPLVPGDLDAIVLGCLRRSPKDRFRTAREVLDAFDALEARARNASQRRLFLPLCAAALLAATAAYVAAVPSNRQPVAAVAVAPPRLTPREEHVVLPAPVARLAPPSIAEGDSSASRPRRPEQMEKQRPSVGNRGGSRPKPDLPTASLPLQPTASPAPANTAAAPPKVPKWEDPFDAGSAPNADPGS